MPKLAEALDSGRFAVTSELVPPKGVDLEPLFAKADSLKDSVDAFNITDSHSARMCISPLAVSHLLLDRGVEPILQMTTRDRNRIALQSDLLGAAALGIPNVVVMGGDPPKSGDHPDAKPVFDLFASQLISAANGMRDGHDMNGNELAGKAEFCLGAVVNPGTSDLPTEIMRMGEKADAGARFFQTQAVYDPAAFERFADELAKENRNTAVLAGIILLKSEKMAKYMNDHVPGVDIPDALVEEIATAEDRKRAAVDIAVRTIEAIEPMCQGVHLMAIGWEDLIPEVAARI
ncbi:MAG: methylenetetrahydrofolate reductase [Gammaproteobacteria bacterium]